VRRRERILAITTNAVAKEHVEPIINRIAEGAVRVVKELVAVRTTELINQHLIN